MFNRPLYKNKFDELFYTQVHIYNITAAAVTGILICWNFNRKLFTPLKLGDKLA